MNKTYFAFFENDYHRSRLSEVVRKSRDQQSRIWSARLGTGLVGLTDCEQGNIGPKSYSEVLLALGDDGLRKLVDLGFITCPACTPEKTEGFWDAVKDTAGLFARVVDGFDGCLIRFEYFGVLVQRDG